jgi:PIN domain nuclease of toxin-antitoxin system
MILLDTHVLLWLADEPRKLSRRAADAVAAAVGQGGLAISAITLWEVAGLIAGGKVDIGQPLEDFLEELTARTAIVPITTKIAALAYQLPENFPGDPADRLIGATAWAGGIPLVTKDRHLQGCARFKTIW